MLFFRYGIEPYVTAKWDHMQHYLHCCGGNNYQIGYKDYRVTPIGQNFSVPDSCCFEYAEGCGYHIFHRSDVEIANVIFVHGCLTLLKDQVKEPEFGSIQFQRFFYCTLSGKQLSGGDKEWKKLTAWIAILVEMDLD